MTDLLQLIDEWGPEKVVTVSDRRSGMKGVLVIDNTARGMGKGGTRMGPDVSTGEIARLARVMTWKWAAVDLFFGGAKAGIVFDPASPDKERALRAFARALSNEVPREYVLGLDMGLTERDAAIVQDELGDRGAMMGAPASLGGLPYDELGVTGFGVAEVADELSDSLRGKRISIQGFGAVGAAAARRFAELGAVVVAVSSVNGALHDPDGLDVARLLALRAEVGENAVTEYGRVRPLGSELLVACDVLVPAATQDVIDKDWAGRVDTAMVVEGANLPTTPAAQDVLAARGITVVPDFIANAGGVVAAAFGMDARYSPFPVEVAKVMAAVSEKLRGNAALVVREAGERGVTTHEVARSLAQERVLAAMRAKGQVT
ncbi:Glu/Leu/Phe/Val dehydrogenase dimerization domain-containing protein [Umezawaea sp. Da 62-37]|uniref:Glu/Leu/Phe/Val family dehydrogenase n=1 Tax=Umezawaea sp. Da 62-37 TaxID=3075927 RepID=UPI0028F6C2CD|nr:Glu/Leu/Phe/Val dehydrogenase dimerization domain-containing protein [Umezawaea sp. Da 62-37]WNV89572.1 Glu/Leu/Phe/Val dehydrogenase dimerization domain-containing protein [Umezawaea sp. Da 62-37]